MVANITHIKIAIKSFFERESHFVELTPTSHMFIRINSFPDIII